MAQLCLSAHIEHAPWCSRVALPRAPASCAAAALAAVIEACKPGAKVVDICEKGDSLLNE